jgi:hypothetical protein
VRVLQPLPFFIKQVFVREQDSDLAVRVQKPLPFFI